MVGRHMRFNKTVIGLISLFSIVSLAYAGESQAEYVGPENDLSIYYLSQFFGPLINDRSNQGQGVGIFFILTQFTLQVSLITAFVLIAYMTALSTIRSAHEGSMFGKDVSSLLSPLRIVFGVGLLVPRADGYASLQHVFMWFILKGIFLANSMWAVVEQNFQGTLPVVPGVVAASESAKKLTLSFYKIAAAISIAQKYHPTYTTISIDKEGFVFIVDEDSNSGIEKFASDILMSLVFLVTPKPDKIKISQLPLMTNTNVQLDLSLFSGLLSEFVEKPFIVTYMNDKKDFSYQKSNQEDVELLKNRSKVYKDIFEQDSLKVQNFFEEQKEQKKQNKNEQNNFKQGWMGAGSMYWTVFSNVQKEPPNKVREWCKNGCKVKVTQILIDYNRSLSEDYKPSAKGGNPRDDINNLFDAFYKNLEGGGGSIEAETASHYEKFMQKLGSNSDLAKLLLPKNIFDFNMESMYNDRDIANKDIGTDRLAALIANNAQILSGVIYILLGSIGLTLLMPLITGIMSGYSPFLKVGTWVILSFFLLNISIIVVVVPSAILGSMYLALIPSIIFFAASASWFMKVIESIVVAPIIAVGLMIPTRDEFSRARTAFQQLLVVIFKPSLIIIGVVASSKIVNISLMFAAVVFSNVFYVIVSNFEGDSLTTFFLIGMMFNIATTIIISLVTRAYGAIYLVPDQVFSAIGIKGEEGNESQELISSLQQGAQQASQSVSGFLSVTDVVTKTFKQKRAR